jgi:HEAT repeat protein
MTTDPESEVRAAAIGALALGWPEPDWIYPLLLNRLKVVDNSAERSAIGWALGGLPPPPVESFPALLDALSLDNWVLRETVPTALAKLGPAARPALPALAKLAARELADPRDSALPAAAAIPSIDPDSAEAQAQLAPVVALLRDSPEGFVRQQAAMVLSKYGPSASAAVPALRQALSSEVADVRQRAALLLGSIGPAAQPALSGLDAMATRDPDASARQFAAQAVKRISVQ